jgi:hypothetical protein
MRVIKGIVGVDDGGSEVVPCLGCVGAVVDEVDAGFGAAEFGDCYPASESRR